MPNIKEVARVAGVGVATVSRVLSGQGYVSVETRRKVTLAAAEVGYSPNGIARALRSNRRHVVGLVLPDLLNEFYRISSSVIQQVLEANGYGVLLGVTNSNHASEHAILCRLREQRVDGIIYVPSAANQGDEALADGKLPMVELHRHSGRSDVDAVLCDELDGNVQLTRHLLELGHRRIALIVGSQRFSTTRERVEGVQAAIAGWSDGGSGVSLSVLYGTYTAEWGREALAGFGHSASRPTAFIAGSSMIALGCIEAIDDLELSMPGDLSLVSCGYSEWFSVTKPKITAFKLPHEAMGQLAAETLIARIEHNGPAVSTAQRLPGVLLMGSSTAPPRG